MASPKPQTLLSAPSSPEKSCVVEEVDCSEHLVWHPSTVSECVEVSTSNDPLALTAAVPCSDAVLDSNEPPPLVSEPVSDSSTAEQLSVSGCSPEKPQQKPSTGSSGKRRKMYSDEVRMQWNLVKIVKTLYTHEQCVAFAEQRGLLPTMKMCNHHRKLMRLDSRLGIFRCGKSKCRSKTYSQAKGTLFENAHLPLPLIFQIMYMFSANYSYATIRRETSHFREEVLSEATIADWFNHCRNAIVAYELEHVKQHFKENSTEAAIVSQWRKKNHSNFRDNFEELLKCILYKYNNFFQ